MPPHRVRLAHHSLWRTWKRMEGFKARESMAGKGSMCRLETGLLQNGQIWEAKGNQLLQPSQHPAFPAHGFSY